MVRQDYDFYNLSGKPDIEKTHLLFELILHLFLVFPFLTSGWERHNLTNELKAAKQKQNLCLLSVKQ